MKRLIIRRILSTVVFRILSSPVISKNVNIVKLQSSILVCVCNLVYRLKGRKQTESLRESGASYGVTGDWRQPTFIIFVPTVHQVLLGRSN